jgi:hypothetical protein
MHENKGVLGLGHISQTSAEMASQSNSDVEGGAGLEGGGKEERLTHVMVLLLLPRRMQVVTSLTIKSAGGI